MVSLVFNRMLSFVIKGVGKNLRLKLHKSLNKQKTSNCTVFICTFLVLCIVDFILQPSSGYSSNCYINPNIIFQKRKFILISKQFSMFLFMLIQMTCIKLHFLLFVFVVIFPSWTGSLLQHIYIQTLSLYSLSLFLNY